MVVIAWIFLVRYAQNQDVLNPVKFADVIDM